MPEAVEEEVWPKRRGCRSLKTQPTQHEITRATWRTTVQRDRIRGMDWQKHIERVPGVMVGKPIFRGTRITVEFVLERLAQGARPEDLVHEHPPLTAEHVSAALAYTLSVVRQDELLETTP